jgi:uncharacterized protein (TIRG00374 family)
LSDDLAPAPSAGRRWLQVVKLLVGVALLVAVVWMIDWRDSIVLEDGTPKGHRVTGELLDDVPRHWDAASTVRFRDAESGAVGTYTAANLRTDKSGPDVNEGLIRLVKRSDKGLLALGLLAYGLIAQIGVLRWWLLLRAQDIRVPFGLARRLTFLGFFFNNVVPGPTGGDLVKAVYISRRTHKRAQSIVTVVIDRVAGIIALALIAAVVLVFNLDNPEYRELAAFIGLFLGGVAVASMLFFSRRVRRFIRFEHWSARLPGGGMIRKADEAVFLWRHHKRAVAVALLLSFANQLSIQGLMLLFASALHVTTAAGEPLVWWSYMVVLPVAFIVTALPVLPGGWGVREAAFAACFHFVGVERNPAIALSVVNGMTQLAWSLLGGVYFLADRGAGSVVTAPPGIDEAVR